MSREDGAGPRATLRLQLHAGYTLDDARADLPYFSRLGVSHLYLSPVSQAREGSTHGYDVVDHGVVDAARGGEQALRRLAAEARRAGLGILLDIVPNHMSTDPANRRWWDVLAHGRQSAAAQWFDIDWDAPAMAGRILAPFLAQPYADALRNGDIRLRHASTPGLYVDVQGTPYPLAPDSISHLAGGALAAGCEVDPGVLQAVLDDHAPERLDGRRRLDALLGRQHYRLAWWRRAAELINWRRFFEVSELIGVRIEDDAVFDVVHALPLRLYAEGIVDGLRIDHVDGLAQPLTYCHRLRAAMRAVEACRPPALGSAHPWVVVEKILAPGETLDERWAVSGTTGYDFAADVGGLLHDEEGEAALVQAWAALAGDARPPGEWLVEARQEMLDRHFVAERSSLLEALARVSGQPPNSPPELGRALDAFLSHYPTYRSYVEDGARSPIDQAWFDQAMQGAAARLATGRDVPAALLRKLDHWLGGQPPRTGAQRLALRRFQQLTPPLAAKSLEDTVFYRYGCLLSRNEVGSDPAVFAVSIDDFHDSNVRRARSAPQGLLATATHDHKRGEDLRARLAVLSEIPDDWLRACRPWLAAAPDGVRQGGAARGFHYMLLQMLVGAWPPALSPADSEALRSYLDRIGQWGVKALREGKQLSSWFEPDEAQEAAWLSYLQGMLPGGPHHETLTSIHAFARRIEPAGISNGLVQTALRMTCPGIPDLYQGTEWPDFSLVDPDNRRPVDFQARAFTLARMADGGAHDISVRAPLQTGRCPPPAWADGRVKQALIAALLALRRDCPAAFQGGYRPLQVHGAPGNILAFSRGNDVVVVAGVKCAALLRARDDGMPALPAAHWGGATLALPDGPGEWRDVLRGGALRVDGAVPAADLLAGFPLAVLRRYQG